MFIIIVLTIVNIGEGEKRDMKKKSKYVIILMLVTASINITILPVYAQQPPIADAGSGYYESECLELWFDASGSDDPDGDDLIFRWDFENDGTWDTNWSDSPYATHLWLDDHVGLVKVEVSDGMFITNATAPVLIFNLDPIIMWITGPTDPIYVGEECEIIVDFYDGDNRSGISSDDSHLAAFLWEEDVIQEYDIPIGETIVIGTYCFSEPGSYLVEFIIEDDDGGVAMGKYLVIVAEQTVSAGPDMTINEGDELSSLGYFIDPGSENQSATVDYGDGSGIQPLGILPSNTFELQHIYEDDGIYAVIVEVIVDDMELGSDNMTVTVNNIAPDIIEIDGSVDPVALGESVEISGEFYDPGILDTHMVTIMWNDTIISELDLSLGERGFSASNIYEMAGVYTIMIVVEDDDGGWDAVEFKYIVIFDPDEGFVTGGGWIESLEGAFPANPNLTGTANFGFVSKYKKGQSVPSGNTEFQFQVADINFHSRDYDWLVIAGPKAMFKGTGTINGDGTYGFLISAIDGEQPGGGDEDKFRIKIWDKDLDDIIIYDNNIGEGEDQPPSTILQGGQIKIHKK